MEALDYSIFPEKPVVYASFWIRFAAYIIDVLILLVPNFIVKGLFSFLFGRDILLGSIAATFIMDWLYYALMESGPNMATPGKKAVNIRVTDLDGNRITFNMATGRYFGKIISGIILLMGYFMMLWDEKSQTLHDKMAGTLVIQE